jgi:hypothetical protein
VSPKSSTITNSFKVQSSGDGTTER